MHTRLSSLKKYAHDLKYDRFTVNMLDESQIEELNKARELVDQIIEEKPELTPDQQIDFDLLCVQCGLFSAFAIEDYAGAKKYFFNHNLLKSFYEAWQDQLTISGGQTPTVDIHQIELSIAELWSYYLYSKVAHTMPPLDERALINKQFESLLAYYEALDAKYTKLDEEEDEKNLVFSDAQVTDDAARKLFDIKLAKAFLQRYFAVFLHKLSLVHETPVTDFSKFNNAAQKHIEDSLYIDSLEEKRFPFVSLDLAASRHLLSDIYVAQGDNQKALIEINAADDYMKLFNNLIKRTHFFTMTVQHAQGDVLSRLGLYSEAIPILNQVVADLKVYKKANEKLATTYELLGLAYENERPVNETAAAARERYKTAHSYYQNSLNIRMELGSDYKKTLDNITRVEAIIDPEVSVKLPLVQAPVSVEENVTNPELENQFKASSDESVIPPLPAAVDVPVPSNVHLFFQPANPATTITPIAIINRSDTDLDLTTKKDPEIVESVSNLSLR